MLSKISFSPSIIGSITISMEKIIIQPINSNISTGFTIDRITVSESDSTGGGAAHYSQKISFSGLKTMTIGSHSGTDYFIATLSNGKKYNLTKNGQVIDISDCTHVSFSTSWIGAEGGESASISNIVFS